MAQFEAILRKLLNSIAEQHNYKDHELTINPFDSKGANYTSKLFQTTISAKDQEDLKLFAKVALMGKTLRNQVRIRLYETELFVYNQLKYVYEGIQEKHSVPTEHKLVFPKFYGSHDTELQETIVLEDLTARGFSCYSRFESIDWPYAVRAVDEMAKLHALSIAFATESPKEFQKMIEEYKSHYESNVEAVKVYWKNMLDWALQTATEENAKIIKEYYKGKNGEVAFVDMGRTLKRPIMAHTDFRPSNLMHKVNEDGKMDLKIIDYQTLQAGCPVYDLLYFIMTASDSAFRKQYQIKLREHYYESLRACLKRLNVNPDVAYPRENFDYEWNEMMPTALTMAIFALPIVTVNEEDAPVIDQNTDMNGFKIGKTSQLFTTRINEVIDDLRESGVLQSPSSSSAPTS